ncbi:MAG TPA: hypothetical protein VG326_13740 [Tepidisphaeraceae bacterium]|jgi:hypothetical protein|nr:hypothetical protein [Tepidisphaeraceae bacterium]
MRPAFLAVLFISLLCASSRADDSSALINEALDKMVTLDVDGVLPSVIKKITDQTAVPIEVPPHVYELLPWGEQTSVKATIKGQTLRQALTALTHKLGLSWEVGPQTVLIKPRPPLDRLGRRATIQELTGLDLLDVTPLGQSPPPGKGATVEWVVNAVDQKLAELKSNYAVEFRPGDKAKADQPVSIPRNAMLGDALKEISKQTDLTWYPWGLNIVIIPKLDQIARQLDRTVTKRYSGVEVGQVLGDLSKSAGVAFSLEAGALQRVPPEFRRITLILDNARVREALEEIRGVTGLDYVVKPTGIYLWNQNPPALAPVMPPGGPIIATLQLDNGMSLFLRAGDLPADILDYAEHKKLQEYKRLRQMMKDEQFVPATQPTTHPAP